MRFTISFLLLILVPFNFASAQTSASIEQVSSSDNEEIKNEAAEGENVQTDTEGEDTKDETSAKDQTIETNDEILKYSWKARLPNDDDTDDKHYDVTLTFFNDKVIIEVDITSETNDYIYLKEIANNKVYLEDGSHFEYSIEDDKLILDYGKEGVDTFSKEPRSQTAEELDKNHPTIKISIAKHFTKLDIVQNLLA